MPQQSLASKSKACDLGYRVNTQTKSCEKVKVPENGKLNRFGDDFECNRGYMKNSENWSCNQIKLPENGVLTVAGNDWRCISTYKREGDRCLKVEKPENSKYLEQGYEWFCHSNFKKEGEKCLRFDIPANAKLSYLGNDWLCNKGFVKNPEKKSCEAVTVPTNASANYIGTFNCNSGYQKIGSNCKKIPDIENGRFYEFGIDFYCISGYQKNEELRNCEKIEILQNAKADSASLDGWVCLGGYVKEGNTCKDFDLPEHSFWFNNYWGCEPGYKKNLSQKSCEKISIPENAHASNTFDGWICNSGYTKNYKDNRCEKTP